LQTLAIDDFAPSLTFILDIDVATGLERSNKRLASAKGFQNTEDRFERMETAFHDSIRQGFLDIAKKNPQRCRVISAAQELNIIAEEIKKYTLEKLRA
jgi:dTMP kinase